MIRSYVFMIVMSLVILALLIGPILVQGCGRGYERGGGIGMRVSMGVAPEMYECQRAGFGESWTMMTTQPSGRRVLVSKITDLHNGIRAANQELHLQKTMNAPTDTIHRKMNRINVLGTKLQAVNASDQGLHQ